MTTVALDKAHLAEAYPPPPRIPARRPWVKANFATTPNGVIKMEGKSMGVSGPPDRKVFEFLRANCDTILVGASTARIEKYSTPKPSTPEAKPPLLVVVTNSLDLDERAEFFDQHRPPLIATSTRTAQASKATIERISEHANVMAFGDTSVELSELLAHLRTQGATTLLCEGGSRLFSELLKEKLVDELCLTISPRIGNGSPTGFADIGDAAPIEMTLASFFEVDNYLFCRYLINEH